MFNPKLLIPAIVLGAIFFICAGRANYLHSLNYGSTHKAAMVRSGIIVLMGLIVCAVVATSYMAKDKADQAKRAADEAAAEELRRPRFSIASVVPLSKDDPLQTAFSIRNDGLSPAQNVNIYSLALTLVDRSMNLVQANEGHNDRMEIFPAGETETVKFNLNRFQFIQAQIAIVIEYSCFSKPERFERAFCFNGVRSADDKWTWLPTASPKNLTEIRRKIYNHGK